MAKSLLPRLKLSPGAALGTQIYTFLRELIIERKIEPGTALSENELALHFEVSRHPVREALNRLSNIGLVDILPQKGSYVSRISVKNLEGICFVRTAIESQAVRNSQSLGTRTFSRITSKLQRCLEQQRRLEQKSDPRARFLKLDDQFHRIICEFSGNSLAWEVIDGVKANMDRIRYLTLGTQSEMGHLIAEHEAICEAICLRHTEEACSLIASHAHMIMETYIPIREANSSWFIDTEEVDHAPKSTRPLSTASRLRNSWAT